MADSKQVWCWVKNKVFVAGGLAGALTAIIVTISYIDQYRWWVWASEFRIVANRVYEVTIPEQRRVISGIERDLERAKSVPPSQRDVKDVMRIIDLEEEKAKAKENLDKLYDERELFAPK